MSSDNQPEKDLTFKRYLPPKGMSKEELKVHFDRIREEDRIISEKRFEPYRFDYQAKLQEYGYTVNDLPDFLRSSLKMHCMLKEQAEQFIEIFCIPYLEEQEIRDEYHGKYIFVEDGVWSISDNFNSIDFNSATDKTFIKIGGEKPINGYGKIVKDLTIQEIPRKIDEHEFIEYRPVSFIVECGVGTTDEVDSMLCENKIFDSGLEISHLMNDSIWDYNNKKFTDEYISKQLIKCKISQTMYTCNGPTDECLVFLKKPLYVSMEGLKPVEIHSFIMPYEKPETPIFLVGMDIISQYSWCYGTFDGKRQLRIKDMQEFEFKASF